VEVSVSRQVSRQQHHQERYNKDKKKKNDTHGYTTSKGAGYKQDYITTYIIGKIFFFFNNTFLIHIQI